MNAPRRKRLEKQIAILQDALAEIELVHAEEQEAMENLPESFIDKSDAMQEGLDLIDNTLTTLPDLIEELQQIANGA